MGRPTNEVPPIPPADDHAAVAVGLPDLRDPVDFPELTPPADEAQAAVTNAGVILEELLPDFFGF